MLGGGGGGVGVGQRLPPKGVGQQQAADWGNSAAAAGLVSLLPASDEWRAGEARRGLPMHGLQMWIPHRSSSPGRGAPSSKSHLLVTNAAQASSLSEVDSIYLDPWLGKGEKLRKCPVFSASS